MNGLNITRQLYKFVIRNVSKFTNTAFSSKYLLYTNIGISFTLSGVGDFLEQQYELLSGDLKRWDRRRTLKMAITGITVGIMCHYYYILLDKRFPGRTLGVLTKKVLIDQIVCSPLCISTFLITVSYLEGHTTKRFIEGVKQKGRRLLFADWIVWPPAQYINFYFLPTKYRVLYDSTISLGFDIYTSYVNHDQEEDGSIDS